MSPAPQHRRWARWRPASHPWRYLLAVSGVLAVTAALVAWRLGDGDTRVDPASDTEQPAAAPGGPGGAAPRSATEAHREREAIIREAGPTDRSAMRRSGTIRVTEDGATIEDVRVSGAIIVRADDVTIRNCDVRGYSNSALIRTYRGFSGTHVEHCYLEAVPGPGGRATNGVVLGGAETYVGHTEITGYADGIKAEHRSTYEANHIHMTKPPGSEKHLDGIQASGDTGFTIRRNVIDVPAASGGNSAIFVQPWNGSRNYEISDIVIQGNHLRGGNFTVFLMGGEHMRDVTFTDNVFAADGHRYGHSRVNNCAEVTSRGNVLEDGGPVEGTC